MFSSLVVPLDLSNAADRALPVVAALARLGGVPVELVTVVPHDSAGGVRTSDLDERVRSLAVGAYTSLVVEGDDPGTVLFQHVRGRDGALIVMATTAKAAVDETYGGSVSEQVLAAGQPVLLVGPRVDVQRPHSSPSLVLAVDGSELAAAALPVILSWMRTFDSAPVTVVEVIPLVPAIAEQAGPALEARNVRRYAERLEDLGIVASGAVVHGHEVADELIDHITHVRDPVLVVAAEPWPDAGTHWRSTSRKLAFRATCPVLVVPATGS